MNLPVKRKTIAEIFQIKLDLLQKLEEIDKLDTSLDLEFQEIKGYRPYRISYQFDVYGEKRQEKYIDRTCWNYLIRFFELEKYMLCTDYEKMQKQIDGFDFPVFSIENAEGYIAILKDIMYDNVKTMMKSVYERITDSCYYTGGSSYNSSTKKKRNNNGIDSNFIITTHDYSRIFGYYRDNPTITDDLEKLCYILDGKKLPSNTIIYQLRGDKFAEGSNDYFKIKCCKNGNTHYTLQDDIKNKLNLYGGDPSRIGENIKIKVFD